AGAPVQLLQLAALVVELALAVLGGRLEGADVGPQLSDLPVADLDLAAELVDLAGQAGTVLQQPPQRRQPAGRRPGPEGGALPRAPPGGARAGGPPPGPGRPPRPALVCPAPCRLRHLSRLP